MIVITTPTGDIGSRVLENILAGRPGPEAPVRVVVRDPARLPDAVRDRVEVVTGSHSDPGVVARAFDGAEAVFWVVPPNATAARLDDAYTGFTRPFADAIAACGVSRVVDVTALGRGTPLERRAGLVTASLAMDDLIAGTGVAFRALACGSFMDNMLRQVPAIRGRGTISDVVAGDRPAPTVATRDIAAVAARLLLDTGWSGQEEVPLLGPEDLSYDELAAVVSDVLGRTVKYQQVPAQARGDQLSGFGMAPAMVEGMLAMMAAKDEGLDLGATRTPRNAVETPTTFRAWCEEVLRPAVQAA